MNPTKNEPPPGGSVIIRVDLTGEQRRLLDEAWACVGFLSEVEAGQCLEVQPETISSGSPLLVGLSRGSTQHQG